MRSGLDEDQDPPSRGDIATGGIVKNAVVVLENLLGGRLPGPLPLNAWMQLTTARDNEHDDREWQRVANNCGECLLTWAKSELLATVKAIDPITLGEAFGNERLVQGSYELKYREHARKLIPGFESPRDVEKMAALLCHETGLQPSEFRQLNPKERCAFAELVLERRQSSGVGYDKQKKPNQAMPDSADVRDLCHLLNKAKDKIASGELNPIDIARTFTKEIANHDRKAKNLLRQARRFPHLWKPADM